ncbi:hypothetical protein CALVIDRAFT_505610, partial [Calocera viscosa TUFC12733]
MSVPSSGPTSALAKISSALTKLTDGAKALRNPFKKKAEEIALRVTGLHEVALAIFACVVVLNSDVFQEFRERDKEHQELLEMLEFLTTRVLNELAGEKNINNATREAISSLQQAVDDVETLLRSQGEESETKLVHIARNSLGDLRQRLDQQSHRFALVSVTQLTKDASARPNIPADLNRIKPPPKPAIFYGREDLVQTIVDLLLKDETCRVPLLGAGGIGKTALVTTILNDERVKNKFGQNVFFLSCESLISASAIILALASALGLQQDGGARQAVIHYLSSFKYVLLALDNFETAWDSDDRTEVEALLTEFAAVSSLSLFVTMRGALRPAGVDWTDRILNPLGSLSIDAARDMWMRIAKKADSKVDDLLRLLDGLPLAIMLMAQQGQVLSTMELFKSYNDERTALLSRGNASRLESLEISIELSLNSRTMQAERNARRLLSALCLLPNETSLSQFDRMLPSMPHSGRYVRVLLHAALAVNKAGKISTLSPIREFMLQKYPPEDADVADIRAHFTGLAHLVH